MNACSTETKPSIDFRNVWDNYANRYNELSEKMQEAGIPSTLLRNVVDAAREVQRVW